MEQINTTSWSIIIPQDYVPPSVARSSMSSFKYSKRSSHLRCVKDATLPRFITILIKDDNIRMNRKPHDT